MKYLITLLSFLLFAWMGMWWYYSCDWCAKNNSGPSIVDSTPDPEAEALAKKAYEDSIANAKRLSKGLFAVDDQNEDVFRYPDNLYINNANGNVSVPDALQDFGDRIVEYLGQNQNKELIISGYETSVERESGVKLGLSRAGYIKTILTNLGLNGDRIVTKPELSSYSYDSEGKYHGGILLKFQTLSESRLSEIEKGVANKTLYSGFAQKTFTPDATLANYALELKNFLNRYPDKTVQIVGHTDNVGNEEANLWFGQERANNVKQYLISQGIDQEKLNASSKGESNPIVSNNNEENRAKNRRIEITVN